MSHALPVASTARGRTEDDEIDFFTEEDELAEDDEIIAMPSGISPTFDEENEDLDMLPDLEFEHEENKDIIPAGSSTQSAETCDWSAYSDDPLIPMWT